MNRTFRSVLFALLFAGLGLLLGLNLRSSLPSAPLLSAESPERKLQQALSYVESRYVEPVDKGKLVEAAINGMMKELDPHSFYITAEDMQGMAERMEGSFEGIGIEFSILEDTLYIETPLPGGPSEKAGLLTGDRIIEVNGENIAGIGISNQQVMKYLKGPKGSEVRLGVLRRGGAGRMEFTLRRDRIPLNSLEYAYMLDARTGYLRLTNFAETTYDEFSEALRKLQGQGMQQLILDLRGNPGGYLNMATRIADEFLGSGKLIVSTTGRTRDSEQAFYATASLDAFEAGALIVLIDYGSASASEIVAGAVQDHDRGLVVGLRSFGKGMVQVQESFGDGSAMRLVVSRYYTPSGRCIQKPYQQGADAYEQEVAGRWDSGEVFDPSMVSFPDSLKYQTGAGRTVYGGGGIFPDVFVGEDSAEFAPYLTQLRMKDLFRGFALDHVERHPELLGRFPDARRFVAEYTLPPSLLAAFLDYASRHGVAYDAAGYRQSQALIENRLKAFLGRRLFGDDGFYPVLHQADRALQEARRLTPAAAELLKTGKLPLTAHGATHP
jgi:carboxyl-terminal processing protease